jgi:transposase
MSRPIHISEEALKRAHALLDSLYRTEEIRRALVVIFAADGRYTMAELAERFHVTIPTCFADISKLNKTEEVSTESACGGRRYSFMTPEQEHEFPEQFSEKAKRGEIVSSQEIHAALAKKVGKDIPKSTVSRILNRNNWRKVKPDTKHPKGDPEVQEDWKKKHLRFIWKKF